MGLYAYEKRSLKTINTIIKQLKKMRPVLKTELDSSKNPSAELRTVIDEIDAAVENSQKIQARLHRLYPDLRPKKTN